MLPKLMETRGIQLRKVQYLNPTVRDIAFDSQEVEFYQ